MKKTYLILLIVLLCLSLMACKVSVETPEKETGKIPVEESTTVPAVITEPETTVDPFEFESEIDFSEFETEGEPEDIVENPTEPEQTEPQPTEPVVTPTEPTEPDATDPKATDPEETTPAPTTPSIGADGYNNQIVRP